MPNGALVSCGTDKSICFWEERKGASASCGACCNIMWT